jgi:hypothetical protein
MLSLSDTLTSSILELCSVGPTVHSISSCSGSQHADVMSCCRHRPKRMLRRLRILDQQLRKRRREAKPDVSLHKDASPQMIIEYEEETNDLCSCETRLVVRMLPLSFDHQLHEMVHFLSHFGSMSLTNSESAQKNLHVRLFFSLEVALVVRLAADQMYLGLGHPQQPISIALPAQHDNYRSPVAISGNSAGGYGPPSSPHLSDFLRSLPLRA